MKTLKLFRRVFDCDYEFETDEKVNMKENINTDIS
jgi:hypothetical protein